MFKCSHLATTFHLLYIRYLLRQHTNILWYNRSPHCVCAVTNRQHGGSVLPLSLLLWPLAVAKPTCTVYFHIFAYARCSRDNSLLTADVWLLHNKMQCNCFTWHMIITYLNIHLLSILFNDTDRLLKIYEHTASDTLAHIVEVFTEQNLEKHCTPFWSEDNSALI